jgi:GNAT superfamily N-acetyltransferase
MNMHDFLVRGYQPGDERGVRRICFDTALFGEPMAPLFDDLQLVTDALLAGHIRVEPASLFVAAADDRVVGYVAGAVDTSRFLRRCALRVGPTLAWDFLTRGHVLRRRSWALMLATTRYGRQALRARAGLLADHPSSLHVNLDRSVRGRGLGRRLVEHFCQYAAGRGSPGVHLSTSSPDGKEFFARMGFRRVFACPTPALPGLPPQELWLMAKAL